MILRLNYLTIVRKLLKNLFLNAECNLTIKSKAFDFIDLPKVLRSEKVCHNFPSNLDISNILMLFHNPNLSIISTFF